MGREIFIRVASGLLVFVLIALLLELLRRRSACNCMHFNASVNQPAAQQQITAHQQNFANLFDSIGAQFSQI